MARSGGDGTSGQGGVVAGLAGAALLGFALLRQAKRPAGERKTPTPGGAVHPGPDEVVGPAPSSSGGKVAQLRQAVDRQQRRRPTLGFPIGVGKKFGEDKAGLLAALVAYFGFFSLFPLMLAFTSVLGFVLTDPEDQRTFADAAADQIPVVGDTIRDTAGQLDGSVIAIAVGVALALWSGLRIVDAMQNALNDVWDVPPVSRPSMAMKRLRGVLMLGLIGGGLVGSVAASNVANLVDVIPGAGRVSIWVLSAVVSVLLYLLAFRLLTDTDLAWGQLWPGAIFGGVCWWALQTFGSIYIVRQQESAGEAYGQFASIIALLAFLFLAAQLSIIGAEINVVRARRLWPRSLTKGEFTEADLRAFDLLASSTRQAEGYEVRIERAAPARSQ